MKKIMFGIMLIFLSMALMFLREFNIILIVSEDFEAILCAILPLFGFVMGVWGLFAKNN